jgi:UDP-N-acetylmuramoyl-tripeptide--D-alanyl-D-alanine ligase
MSVLWNAARLAKATGSLTQGEFQAERVEIDSRAIKAGDLFVALRGERFDGNDFVAGALAQGAVAAVMSRPVEAPGVVVEDTLVALEAMGCDARTRLQGKVVGVTGSVGKTSTKEMLRLALAAHGSVHATRGNYNNHIGTPLNLANMPPESDFAVLEMGMNHGGEIAHLTRMVRPHVAVITCVEAVHLEFFDSINGIADAKAEIFEGLEPGGVAIINADQPYKDKLASKAKACGASRVLTFGESESSDCQMVDYTATREGSRITARILGEELSYTIAATGRHFAMATLIALASAAVLGLDLARTATALAAFDEVDGRGRVSGVVLGDVPIILINDSYNASPAAMRAAFAKTNEVWKARGGHGRKVALLGDMLELGATGPQLHAQLAASLVEQEFALVHTAGPLMQHLHKALPVSMRGTHVAKAAELQNMIGFLSQDVVLIKGSHGSKIYEVADAMIRQAKSEPI